MYTAEELGSFTSGALLYLGIEGPNDEEIGIGKAKVCWALDDSLQEDMGVWGTLHAYTNDGIFSNVEYPLALEAEGLSRKAALSLAAGTIVAYSTVNTWRKNLISHGKLALDREANRASMLPRYPQLWDDQDFVKSLGKQTYHVVEHRMAAGIAGDADDFNPADFDPTLTPAPFPVHIASLADPFSLEQIQKLYKEAEKAF